jgi:hypothetical protein
MNYLLVKGRKFQKRFKRIIAYIGVMFGAAGSAVLLNKISKTVGANIGKKVAATGFDQDNLVSLGEKGRTQ